MEKEFYLNEIKRDELYIKLYRVKIMIAKCWMKTWDYRFKHGYFPCWNEAQDIRLSAIWDKIMAEIQTINNN